MIGPNFGIRESFFARCQSDAAPGKNGNKESEMEIWDAMAARHSVRAYLDKPIGAPVLQKLQDEVAECNRESGLKIRLVCDDSQAFSSFLAHYGKFSCVKNYFALIGEKSESLAEKAGYYGERLVLFTQTLGLNTCWVALSYARGRTLKKLDLGKDEKLACVIAVGYGETQGVPHKSKQVRQVCPAKNFEALPAWFQRGVHAALLAPTAVNQQKFKFELVGERKVRARQTGGFCRGLDLGIVKYHFEQGAGKENFEWAE